MEDIITIKGEESGPTSMILVGVHGNERCGVEAIQKLLPKLRIDKGTVHIGYGNPRAIEQGVRFIEVNLNRMFKSDDTLSVEQKNSYEYGRAQYLKEYMDQADVLLDIHASSNSESRIFAICESNADEIIKYLPVPLIVSGFDTIQPGGTDWYMNMIGKIGICVECGYLADPSATIVAEESILNFLVARGHNIGKTNRQEQRRIHVYELYYSKTDSFKLTKVFYDFEEINKGDVIGIDGEESVVVEKDSIILFAHDRDKRGEEAFLLGEYK